MFGTVGTMFLRGVALFYFQGGKSRFEFEHVMENTGKLVGKFSVLPITKFEGDNPYFRQPREVGYFSLDIDRIFYDDHRQQRWYFAPEEMGELHFDLNQGYESFVRRDEEKKDKLDDILRWICKHLDRFQLSSPSQNDKSLHTDFITWRGHLTKLMCTPYESKEPWQMAVALHHGTIYISEVDTKEAQQKRSSQTKMQDRMCYWGYKFEDYVTKPMKDDITKDAINNKEAYCSVVRSRLDKHSLVYGAEVDCCIAAESKKKPPLNYIELKTSRIIDNDRTNHSFERYKLLKWWCQSFLAGVPQIICGFRDDDGIVRKLKTYYTLQIPELVKSSVNMWDGSVCLNFCNQLLDWVKSMVTDDNVVYILHWREPFTHVEIEISKNPKDIFLPNWFVKN